VGARYTPTRPEILLGPARGVHSAVQQQLLEALRLNVLHATTAKRKNKASSSAADNNTTRPELKIVPIRQLYPHFEYTDLAAHPAIVLLPYQVSLMSIIEFYRMQIPLFVPSARLLARWHLRYRVLNERTWQGVLGSPQHGSILPRHPRWDTAAAIKDAHNTNHHDGSSGSRGSIRRGKLSATAKNSSATAPSPPLSDPNDEFNEEAVLEWIALSDFYQWPHVRTFDSWAQLLVDLQNSSLLKTMSDGMGQFNRHEEARIRQEWARILRKVRTHKSSGAGGSSRGSVTAVAPGVNTRDTLPDSVDESLQQMYGYTLSKTDCNGQVHTKSQR
jgi:hypothetical protein